MSGEAIDQRAWFRRIAEESRGCIPADPPPWLGRLHERGRNALARQRPIGRKREAWRYSRIESLFETAYRGAGEPPEALPAGLPEVAPLVAEGVRVVFVDGRLRPELSRLDGLPGGVTVGSLCDALLREPECLAEWFRASAEHADDPFPALNTALLHDGLFLRVPAGMVLERPLEVLHLASEGEAGTMRQLRHRVVLERGAEVTWIERFHSLDGIDHFHNHLAEITLEEGSRLRHLRLQEAGNGARLLANRFITQEGDSRYLATALELGGGWVRSGYDVELRRPGAECRIDGLCVVERGRLVENHLDIRHQAPRCTSGERFRGLVQGGGRAVVDGRVLVARDAQGSDGRLAVDHLLLGRDAEVDVKPRLEIYADDVKCGHGTTVGRLDPEQLFYLRARGIGERVARRMLCLGFLRGLIENGLPEALREGLLGRLEAVLAGRSEAADEGEGP
ncbi:Fe-S cluster assembly protein SufD [Endothiovibrio diazotrophicus]